MGWPWKLDFGRPAIVIAQIETKLGSMALSPRIRRDVFEFEQPKQIDLIGDNWTRTDRQRRQNKVANVVIPLA